MNNNLAYITSETMRRDLSKEKLIALMCRIMNAEGTEEEIDAMITQFNANVPHPEEANLAFYPADSGHGQAMIRAYKPSPEEVVEIALNYKPFVIPPLSNE